MVFSSSLFLFYFLPIFLVCYYLARNSLKNIVALVFSLFFYAWGAPDFLYLVVGSLIIDFYIVKRISKTDNNKKLFLFLSVLLNIGLLGYFKYANFFVENFNQILAAFGSSPANWTEVALPIGISFFTFQKLSYSIDIFRGKSKPLDKITDYAMYIMLFPQLIAGPIVRYNEIADQITNRRKSENYENRFAGMFRFCIGLSKKLLIADTLGAKVDEIFTVSPELIGTEIAWIGIIAYSFQIYYDFSGYSDMAIGIGRMIGFKFPENFNNPYVSNNITEFWRRWHMTLSRWMRDYLYIPLGGNKVKTKYHLFFNLWIVFLLSGLWHGAAWNFVIWGAFHGVFLILDRLFLIKIFNKLGKYPSIAITYFITLIGWVIFRADSAEFAFAYLGKMFSFSGSETFVYFNYKFWTMIVVGFIFAFITMFKTGLKLENFMFFKSHKKYEIIPVMIILVSLLLLSAMHISIGGYNPFIYFRF